MCCGGSRQHSSYHSHHSRHRHHSRHHKRDRHHRIRGPYCSQNGHHMKCHFLPISSHAGGGASGSGWSWLR